MARGGVTLWDVLDRLIDRLPALLLAAALLLCAHVAIFDRDRPRLLVAVVPGFLLLLLYLRAGGAARGGGRGMRGGSRSGGDG